MFCAAYKQPLSDAALTGELTAWLQEHLAACAPCRAAFVEEQSLYGAIDLALNTAANVEVPATLVPRARVALNNEPVRKTSSRTWLFAAVPFAAACVIGIVYLSSRGPHNPVPATENVSNRGLSSAVSSSIVNSPSPRGVITVRHDDTTPLAQRRATNAKFVEVIVEPQEAAALIRYEAQLKERSLSKSSTLYAKAIELPSGIQPLEIAEIEARDLKIPALAKVEADGDMK